MPFHWSIRQLHLRPPLEAQQIMETPTPSLPDDKLDKILGAITATRQDLCNRVDAVAVKAGLLREDQKNLSARVVSTESELRDF
ncbi:hypothetical protein NDU88_001519 [Pleurodeles waltl]|uniref:Uncharacterized protein n=1 Tax=Pleurodeles waltl TaxID=8319 RepID=A0AAV7M1D6_PLEWA|nr:hypothetical protein NDU88_001519 [Pleurodeles waltl]